MGVKTKKKTKKKQDDDGPRYELMNGRMERNSKRR